MLQQPFVRGDDRGNNVEQLNVDDDNTQDLIDNSDLLISNIQSGYYAGLRAGFGIDLFYLYL